MQIYSDAATAGQKPIMISFTPDGNSLCFQVVWVSWTCDIMLSFQNRLELLITYQISIISNKITQKQKKEVWILLFLLIKSPCVKQQLNKFATLVKSNMNLC